MYSEQAPGHVSSRIAWQQFTIRQLLLTMLLVAIGLTIWKASQPQIANEAVRKQLAKRYPAKNTQREGELQFQPGTKLTELETPAISKADSNLRLYHTSLSTGHFMCYPEVEVAVAVWKENRQIKSAEYLSPTYGKDARSFSDRFRGLKAKSENDRVKVAAEICQVFKTITNRGRITDGQLVGDEYRATLWHHDLSWGTLVIKFDRTGEIARVSLNRE